MFNNIKSLFGMTDNASGITFDTIIRLGFLFVIVGVLMIVISFIHTKTKKHKYNKIDEQQIKKAERMTSMQLKSAKLDTAYIEKELKATIESLIYGLYVGDNTYINYDKIISDIGSPIWEKINNEKNSGIVREIYDYKMSDFYIKEQENEFLQRVGSVTCKGSFYIYYALVNNGYKIVEKRTFDQEYTISTDNWIITSMSGELNLITETINQSTN